MSFWRRLLNWLFARRPGDRDEQTDLKALFRELQNTSESFVESQVSSKDKWNE